MKKLLLTLSLGTFLAVPALAATLTITQPNGSEELCLGTHYTIKWTSSGVTTQLKLVLRKNGNLIGQIAENLPAATTQYDWVVGSYIGGTVSKGTGYTIRVRTMENGPYDDSNSSFNIKLCQVAFDPNKSKDIQVAPGVKPQVASFQIISPTGGEHWQKGQRREIRWIPGQASGSIKILLRRFGQVIHTITWGVNVASGKYTWNVYEGNDYNGTPYDPGLLGKDRFEIVIMSLENTPPYRLYTISPGRFSIASIAVTSPGGPYCCGGTYYLGDPLKITWDPNGIEGGLRLSLLWDNTVVGTIAENVPVQYDYNWTVGNYIGGTATPRPGGGYQIKVETMDGYYSALSSKFHILSK